MGVLRLQMNISQITITKIFGRHYIKSQCIITKTRTAEHLFKGTVINE